MQVNAADWSNLVRSGYSYFVTTKGRDLPASDLGLSFLSLKVETEAHFEHRRRPGQSC